MRKTDAFKAALLGLVFCAVGNLPVRAAQNDQDLIVVDALGELRDAPSVLSARGAQAAGSVRTPSQSDFQTGGKVDVERLLGTVNETLSENRDLRKNMGAVQESFERLTIENNVLKSRLRNLERRTEEKDSEKAEILKDFNQRQKQIDALRDQNDAKVLQLVESARKLNDSKAEIRKLQDKLGEAILESERDEYKLRIQNLKEDSEKAVSELAKAKYQESQFQEELGQSCYQMGNMLFEQRQFDKAVEYYQRALQYNPRLSYAHHNLGVIYDYYLNNNPEALKHYKAFLKMDPDDTSADKMKERMLELELAKNVVPQNPLRLDYTEQHRKSN